MKKLAIVLGLIVVMAVGYFMWSKKGATDSYADFSALMNKMVGEQNWRAKSHSASLVGGALIIDGLELNNLLRREDKNEKTKPVYISKMTIEGLVTGDELKRFLAAENWAGQKSLELSNKITIDGLNYEQSFVLPPETKGQSKMATQLKKIVVEGLSLAEQGADGSGAGFFDNLLLDKVSIVEQQMVMDVALDGIAETALKSDSHTELSVGRIDYEKLRGSQANYEKISDLFNKMGLDELTAVLGSFKMGKASFQDYAVDSTAKSKVTETQELELLIKQHVASMEIEGADGFKADLLRCRNWTGSMTSEKSPINMTFKLDEAEAKGFDGTNLAGIFMNFYQLQHGSNPDPMRIVDEFYKLGLLFSLPFDLESARLAGLEFSMPDYGLLQKAAEVSFTGPFKAGEIAPKSSFKVVGLEQTIPSSQAVVDKNPQLADLYQFGQEFGQTTFLFDFSSDTSYDANEGTLKSDKLLSSVDLFDLKYSSNWQGLKNADFAKFKDLPLSKLMITALNPQGDLGDLGISDASLTISDHGLLNKIYAYVGMRTGQSAADARVMVQMGSAMTFASMSDILADPQMLNNTVGRFLEQSGKLMISAKPESGRLSDLVLRSMEWNGWNFIDFLKFNVQYNDNEAQPFRLKAELN